MYPESRPLPPIPSPLGGVDVTATLRQYGAHERLARAYEPSQLKPYIENTALIQLYGTALHVAASQTIQHMQALQKYGYGAQSPLPQHRDSLELAPVQENVLQLLYQNLKYSFFDYCAGREDVINAPRIKQSFLGKGVSIFSEPSKDATASLIVRRSREQNSVNTSKESLDARSRHFFALAQTECIKWLVENCLALYSVGPEETHAAITVAHEAQASFGVDNLSEKRLKLITLVGLLHTFSKREPDQKLARQLHGRAMRLDKEVTQLDYIINEFTIIYAALGYEPSLELDLASYFHEDEDQMPEKPEATAGPLAIGANRQAAERSAHQLSKPDAERQIGEHSAAAKKLEAQWRLSGKQRKGQGVNEFLYALKNGRETENQAGASSVPEDEIPVLTDILIRIGQKQQQLDITALVSELAASLQQQDTLEADIEHLYAQIRQAKLTGLPPAQHVLPLRQTIARLTQDWKTYRHLIRTTWPIDQRHTLVTTLENLLFDASGRPRF